MLARSAVAPRNRESGWGQFRVYWFGHLLSFTGDWFTILALPLVAATVYDSATYVGVVAAAELIATPLMGMRVGAWADRRDPRRTMVATNVICAGVLGAVAYWIAEGVPPMWVLPVTAFLLSVLRDLHDSAENVMVASVVPPDLLVRANGRFQISDGAGHVVGALLAGAIAYRNPSLALVVDGASFILSALAAYAMGHFDVERVAEAPMTPWRATLHAMRTEDRYWRVMTTMAIANITTACVLAPFVIFAKDELGLNPFEIGITWAVMGAGGFIAGLALDRVTTLRPACALVATTVLALSIGVTGLATSWTVTLVTFAAIGAVLALGMTTIGSMRHSSFPPQLQGRVTIATRIAFTAGIVPGVLVAGWLADLDSVGPARMFVLFAFFAGVATGVGIALRVDRLPVAGSVVEDRFARLSAEDAAFWDEAPLLIDLTEPPGRVAAEAVEGSGGAAARGDVVEGIAPGVDAAPVSCAPCSTVRPEAWGAESAAIRLDEQLDWSERDPFELIAFALSQDGHASGPAPPTSRLRL